MKRIVDIALTPLGDGRVHVYAIHKTADVTTVLFDCSVESGRVTKTMDEVAHPESNVRNISICGEGRS